MNLNRNLKKYCHRAFSTLRVNVGILLPILFLMGSINFLNSDQKTNKGSLATSLTPLKIMLEYL